MTILDVRDFYQRQDALEAKGGEEPCTGCDVVFEPGQPYSTYVLTEPRVSLKFPQSILLCQACTYKIVALPPKT